MNQAMVTNEHSFVVRLYLQAIIKLFKVAFFLNQIRKSYFMIGSLGSSIRDISILYMCPEFEALEITLAISSGVELLKPTFFKIPTLVVFKYLSTLSRETLTADGEESNGSSYRISKLASACSLNGAKDTIEEQRKEWNQISSMYLTSKLNLLNL